MFVAVRFLRCSRLKLPKFPPGLSYNKYSHTLLQKAKQDLKEDVVVPQKPRVPLAKVAGVQATILPVVPAIVPPAKPAEQPTEPSTLKLKDALGPNALDWKEQVVALRELPQIYAQLSKARLSAMVVLTAMGGYALAPAPLIPETFLLACLGTGLASAAANTFNQFMEVPYDSQMNRTKNRALVRASITPLHGFMFGLTTTGVGLATLAFGVNPLTAALGALNIVLYSVVYTYSKRRTILNTWIGSVVGAVPPLMGWAACAGTLTPGAYVLAGILYSWQFTHFNALSWNLRADYSRAGYRMMCVTDPSLCLQTTLFYTASLPVLCTLAPVFDVTTWAFAVDSLPVNAYMMYLAYRFYAKPDNDTSRKLFRASLLYLPVIMILMLVSKKYQAQQHPVKSVDKVPAVS